MQNIIRKRINLVRGIMRRMGIDALHLSGTDPHMSEYLCDHWQVRRWLSGFSGSFGEIVITMEEALLWTDSRYFLQAESELMGSGFRMLPLRVPGAQPVDEWLAENLLPGSRVGFDPLTLPLNSYKQFQKLLEPRKIALVPLSGVVTEVWSDRPELPGEPVFELDDSVSGRSRLSKKEEILKNLDEEGAGLTVVTSLSDLAWCFNLRGSDIPYNPLFLGYGVIGKDFYHLFVKQLPPSLKEKLETEGVVVKEYDEFFDFLSSIRGLTLILDPHTSGSGVFLALNEHNRIVETTSPVELLKTVKNRIEQEGFRETMRYDGAAMVQFLWWLRNLSGEEGVTEYSAGRKLAELRSLQPGFVGESFSPIIGYKEHGAIVHLSVNSENALPLKREGLLLFDSGGQYLTGTTDITRTVALGEVTERQKRDFTLVLKGVIALSSVVFPMGTRGIHLDILARQALWQFGLDYGHGTGHGVGHFLSVHEGPAAIRREWNPNLIMPGMVLSNEPGVYYPGEYGIRIENLMICIEKETSQFGKFLAFETLTLCPVDKQLLDTALLTSDEVKWINQYHRRVKEELESLVPEELIPFLEEVTSELEE